MTLCSLDTTEKENLPQGWGSVQSSATGWTKYRIGKKLLSLIIEYGYFSFLFPILPKACFAIKII